MKQFLLVAVMTIVGFAAGFEGRVWQERHGPLPPPPGAFLGELGSKHPDQRGDPHHQTSAAFRANLVEMVAKMKPQIEEFNLKMKGIDDEFTKNLDAIMTPEQKAITADWQKKRDAMLAAHPAVANTKPLTDEEVIRLTQRPFHSMVSFIVLPYRLDQLDGEYHFSDPQKEVVKGLLKTRRDEFLGLIDSAPPPSLYLSKLAPEVARLAAATPAPAVPAK